MYARDEVQLPNDDCADPTQGKRYWAFHADPDSVQVEQHRLDLLRHPMACPSCLKEVLGLLEKERQETKDDVPPEVK